jgi:hypothetical protein
MKVKTTNQKYRTKTPKKVLNEQLSLALASYHKAERSERIKKGLASRKLRER